MADRESFYSSPTEIPKGGSGTHYIEGGYFGNVRRTLIELGSPVPDQDIGAAGDYWKKCQQAGVDPRVCGAIIYAAERHRHNVQNTTIQEPAAAEEPPAKAGEPTSVVHEPTPVVHEGSIPWSKVTRDEALHQDGMAHAERYGAIDSARKVYEVVGGELQKEDQEIFLVMPLNLRGELKAWPFEVARGQRSGEVVGVDDVMRVVVLSGCEGFVCVHNHPSGDPTPSQADRDLTKQIAKATAPFGRSIKFIDHVIVGTGCCYSIVGHERVVVEVRKRAPRGKKATKKRR